MAAAVFFDSDALDLVEITRAALGLKTMAGLFRTAIDKGLDSTDKGSMQAALHYYTSFVRSIRSASAADFTIDDPGDFVALAEWLAGRAIPASLQWTTALTSPMCVDSDGDGAVLATIHNGL